MVEKVAIDLLWLRPGKVGGTESYIRNLLDGFMELESEFDFTLLVSKDNAGTFKKYEKDDRYHLLVADVKSERIAKRIIWQNLHQNSFLRKNGLKKCFEPVYCKPWLNGGIKYICVIHDLQAYHYPQYHPFYEVVYSRLCWRMDTLTAAGIIAISEWVKNDIKQKYHRKDIKVIYNPIVVKQDDVIDFEVLQNKYRIKKKQFFYTVSQMIPHKNLDTIIRMMERLVRCDTDLPKKLLISGVNGSAAVELKKMIEEKKLGDNIILTGFVSNEERNTLYKYCHTFLFPSIFEGFGMPPIEAMLFGSRVVTTRCTSIPEVTQGKAIYVDNPYDENEWIDKIAKEYPPEIPDFEVYSFKRISKQYLQVLKKSVWGRK